MSNNEPTLHVWHNDIDWIIAPNLDAVRAIVEAHYGSTFEDEGWDLEDFEQLEGDTPITINIEDDNDRKRFEPVFICEHTGYTKARKTAAEWAAINGAGFLCSTEF